MPQPIFLRFSSNEDIAITIQCLKRITEKQLDSKVTKVIKPALLRMLLDLDNCQGVNE